MALLPQCAGESSETKSLLLEATLSNINPSIGSGGEEIVIEGAKFDPLPVRVFFGENEAAVLAASIEKIIAIVPACDAPGTVDVRIVAANNAEVTFDDAFTCRSATDCSLIGPEVSSIVPPAGSSGDTIAINGKNFVVDLQNSTQISIGGEQANLAGTISSSLITVSVPDLDVSCIEKLCPVPVTVINPNGCEVTLEEGFVYSRRDTDGDGLTDYEETEECMSDPADPDSDLDQLNDFQECRIYHTDPNDTDTDDDFLPDWEEVVTHESDPLDPDTDCDRRLDGLDKTSRGTLVPTTPQWYTVASDTPCVLLGISPLEFYEVEQSRIENRPNECKVESIHVQTEDSGFSTSVLSLYEADIGNPNTVGTSWGCQDVGPFGAREDWKWLSFPNPNVNGWFESGDSIRIYPQQCDFTDGAPTYVCEVAVAYDRIAPYQPPQ